MKRLISLDVLRGLSIFGMVFSAIVPSGILPAWMYHVQNPPPTHVLDMTVAGISWVDWVFPIFIFCMGVAIPLAGWRKIERAEQESLAKMEMSANHAATKLFLKNVFSRFFLLWAFAYLVVLLNPSGIKGVLDLTLFGVSIPSYDVQALILLGFFALFAFYWVLPPGSKRMWMRIAGILGILGLIVLFHWAYGVPLNLHKRSIIILLLAFLYLFGSLIWYFTRGKIWWRVAVFMLIIAVSVVSKEAGFDSWLYAQKSLRWVFNMEEIYFLIILLPATWVGDYYSGRINCSGFIKFFGVQKWKTPKQQARVECFLAVFAGMSVVFLCFAFYFRWPYVGLLISQWVFFAIIIRERLRPLIAMAFILLIIGGILDIAGYEGGIKKVPATLSYCFSMGGVSILLLLLFEYICQWRPKSFFVRTFSGAGSNPLLSYVAFGTFVLPVLNLTFLMGVYRAAYPADMPWVGVLRAFIIVLFTMYLVAVMSRKKIFWRA